MPKYERTVRPDGRGVVIKAIGYRYMSFEKGSAAISHLALGGPIIAANFSF